MTNGPEILAHFPVGGSLILRNIGPQCNQMCVLRRTQRILHHRQKVGRHSVQGRTGIEDLLETHVECIDRCFAVRAALIHGGTQVNGQVIAQGTETIAADLGRVHINDAALNLFQQVNGPDRHREVADADQQRYPVGHGG